MSTYREIVYMVLDQAKMKVDDNHLEAEHIVAIINKYRASLLKNKYGGQVKKVIPPAYYQTLAVEVDPTTRKSLKRIPQLLDLDGMNLVTTIDAVNVLNTFKITLVSPDRFQYLGHNRYLSTILYGTVTLDNYLKVKYSGTIPSNFLISGLLENPMNIIEFNDLEISDPLDLEFPMDEGLMMDLMAATLKEVAGIRVFPEIDKNNAREENLTSN
ncbi:MAG: hypothetical protein EOL97_14125 [Spirochaetia bacterium]|nr:hypothetical protein [Spirochaetia bacterium]